VTRFVEHGHNASPGVVTDDVTMGTHGQYFTIRKTFLPCACGPHGIYTTFPARALAPPWTWYTGFIPLVYTPPALTHTKGPPSVRVLDQGNENTTLIGVRGATPVSFQLHADVMVKPGSDTRLYITDGLPIYLNVL
jgi:hypothetical protein